MFVAVSGGFDPIHDGHVRYLRDAMNRTGGDTLLVILTRDDQLIAKKGKCWIPFKERKRMLEWILWGKGIRYEVVENIDEDLASVKTLACYRPGYFLKGGNTWTPENLPEWDICNKLGITVIFGVGGFDKERGSSDVKDEPRSD